MAKRNNTTTEEQIMLAAEEVFMEKGFAGARTTDIANRAGVVHPLLYYYFKTKEQLFEEVFYRKINLFVQGILESVHIEELSVMETIARLMSLHFDFLCKNPQLPLFLINTVNENEQLFEVFKPKIKIISQAVTKKLKPMLDEGVAKGEICPTDPFTLTFDIFMLNASTFFIPRLNQFMELLGIEREKEFYRRRKMENIEIIRKRLSIEK